MMHLLILLVWSFVPHSQVFEIPIKQMNIRLADGSDLSFLSKKPQVKKQAIEKNEIKKKVVAAQKKPKEKRVKVKKKAVPSTRKAFAAPKSSDLPWEQIKRNSNVRNNRANYGVSDSNWKNVIRYQEQMMTRYEQMLSAWVDRYKVYPAEAQARGLEGRVLLRIRIDRAGNVKFIVIQKSSHPLLDRAVTQAARKSSPVPKVPSDYPGGQLLEFIIAIDFVYSG